MGNDSENTTIEGPEGPYSSEMEGKIAQYLTQVQVNSPRTGGSCGSGACGGACGGGCGGDYRPKTP